MHMMWLKGIYELNFYVWSIDLMLQSLLVEPSALVWWSLWLTIVNRSRRRLDA